MNDWNEPETAVIMTKDEVATMKKKSKRILGVPVGIAGVVGAVLAFGGAAIAAIIFSMSGSVSAVADNGTAPTISGEHFSGKFYPGAERDLVFTVKNDNDFPVKVTEIAASNVSDLSAGCGTNGAYLSGFATALNQSKALANGGVSVGAHDQAIVTVPNAVKLSSAATAGCSFKLDLKVTGSGAGN